MTHLVSLVGRVGAVHALAGSNIMTVVDLRKLAQSLGLIASKESKKRLAELIVRQVDKRITRSLEELETLSQSELYAYLDSTNCDAVELRELLAEASVPVQGKMSRAKLLELAAIQISNLGMFKRISSSDCSAKALDR